MERRMLMSQTVKGAGIATEYYPLGARADSLSFGRELRGVWKVRQVERTFRRGVQRLHHVTLHPLRDPLEHRSNLANPLQAARVARSALLSPNEKLGVGFREVDLHVEAL